MKHLKYSNDQADRRIKAMRLLQELPEIETKITSGSLNLTNLALAQRLFLHQKKSAKVVEKETKLELLAKLEDQTTRQAEEIVYQIQPEMKPKKNKLTYDSIDDEVLRGKLLQLKGRYAHQDPNMSLSDLLHRLCDQELAEKTAAPSRAPKIESKAEITRQVWRRDGSKCVNCDSTHAVQIEHRIPKAVGGAWALENLCLLCRSCNQRRAIEYYGMGKMEKYLKAPSVAFKAPTNPTNHRSHAAAALGPPSRRAAPTDRTIVRDQ